MVEEEERSRRRTEAGNAELIGIPEKTNVAYGTTKERYIGTTGEGAERAAFSTCGNRTAKDKAVIPIADSESGFRRLQARQPETPNIGEANPSGGCAIGRKTATDHKEPVAMDKGANRKDDSTRLSALALETMAVGPERPRESQEEEGGDE